MNNFQKHIQRDVIYEGSGGGGNLFNLEDVIDYLLDNGFKKKTIKKRFFGVEWSWLKDEIQHNNWVSNDLEVKLYEGDYGNMKHKIFKKDKHGVYDLLYSKNYITVDDVKMALRDEKIKSILDGKSL